MPKKNRTSSSKDNTDLNLLFEISQILDSTMDLREVVYPVLRAMSESLGMKRGAITLVNPLTKEQTIEAAFGLSETQKKKGTYKPGEGVTGKVFSSGSALVIPKVSEDPTFLNRTGARTKVQEQEISFICVPVRLDKEIIGTLSLDREYDPDYNLDDLLQVMVIIASMIAQAVNLRRVVREEQRKLEEENDRLQSELKDRFRPENMIGSSREIQGVWDLIDQVSKSNATVLIRGESGTGKELVASSIHYHSLRAACPYVKVNCAALPESLIESELFGHERGAFTGAVSMRKGRFEMSRGGTIFLDEIGYLTPQVQAKLLRVLQEKEFERVGGTQTISVDVRVVAATNRNLEDLMEKGDFLQDLYYRLNVFPIHLPSLRQRKNDILALADHFVEKYAKQHSKQIVRISTPAIDMMMAYHWPGNIRELENSIERAVLLSNDGVIHGHHLPPSLQTAEASGTSHEGSLESTMANVERELIVDALKSARGNRAKAARSLGISERIMGLRVAKYDIDWKRFRYGV